MGEAKNEAKADNVESVNKIRKKKKTKKLKEKGENSVQLDNEESGKSLESKSKKKLKKRKCEEQFAQEDSQILADGEQEDITSELTAVKKKKKKRKILKKEVDEKNLLSFSENDCLTSKKLKKRMREETDGQKDTADNGIEQPVKKKKKKKSKNSASHLEFLDEAEKQEQEVPQEPNGKDQQINSCSNLESFDDSIAVKKKKKKKDKRNESFSEDTLLDGNESRTNNLQEPAEGHSKGLENKQKKKKTKRKLDAVADSDDNVGKEYNMSSEKKSEGKKKKKKKKIDLDVNNMNIQNESHVTSKFEIKSQSNLKEDSAALNNDDDKRVIENSNGNIQDDGSSVQNVEGQWQGAMFKDQERQNKFLRLLGGMKTQNSDRKKLFSIGIGNSSQKKGLYGSLTLGAPKSMLSGTGGNKAFNVSEAAAVDQRLEEDYNRAMSFKLGGKKSAGLGFAPDPSEGKKFHIDANASKSMKFENSD